MKLIKLLMPGLAIVLLSSCSIYDIATCPTADFVGHDQILSRWIGRNINAYESYYNVQPRSSMQRPMNRIRYTYRVYSKTIGNQYSYCDEAITVNKENGKIVGYSSEGNYCTFDDYCNRK